VLACGTAKGAQAQEWLPICSRCPSPIVYSKTGVGTANAVAEAKMTPAQFRETCSEQGLQGAALSRCVKDEAAADGGKIYRASANCLAGTLSAIDGKNYTFAGVWPNDDIGGGRTRWRDSETGQIVGRDNASGGLGLSVQWEVVCPGPLKISQRPTAARPPVQQASAPVQPASRMPPPPPVCNGAPMCTEVNTFAATISDFRTSISGGYRIVTANIRFQNKLARPIILGYLSGSGVAIDDRGNRFAMNENTGLRGMGFVRANQVDPKFIIGPGETADARVEYQWYPRGGEIFGTMYDLEFAVREIVPVAAQQFRVGLEHPLKWSALGQAQMAAAPAVVPAAAVNPNPAPSPAAATAAPVDYCQGQERCYSTGLFVAQITQVTSSMAGGYQAIGFKVRFRNVTNQPLVLAYKSGTSLAIDNHGQRYAPRGVNAVRGIGVFGAGQVNADFIIQPGQTRDASFEVQRYLARTLVGTGFTWDVAVEQLELLPANQVRSVREYSLNFTDLTAANPVGTAAAAPSGQQLNEATQKLRDIFKRKK
jgi:hypothetical protein